MKGNVIYSYQRDRLGYQDRKNSSPQHVANNRYATIAHNRRSLNDLEKSREEDEDYHYYEDTSYGSLYAFVKFSMVNF